ncbi:MAG: GTP-binding protein, partial [Lautropia sp.]|nr:GTP-binding protein [Lautropia sp.]
MMIGTAGHIDHGKSTLVKALTGTETDRLPEERRRGMSIELGYAFMRGPQAEDIGFIDVPGHEKLLHTMISGATGIDFALLLVAADDGVMPQTREHLAVLSLLGISRGAVALTKTDRVDAARIDVVRAQIGALLAGSSLANAPIMPVSATTGAGVEELRQLLLSEAQTLHAAHAEAAASSADGAHAGLSGGNVPLARGFRLAVDRVFTLDGVGTVATGTVHAGSLRVGDVLDVLPDGPRGVRVRSLRAQNRETAEAVKGQRCAVGLAGIEKSALSRGQWLLQPGVAELSTRLDVEIHLWQGEEKPLRSGMRVHVHLGTESVMASVAVLGVRQPGGEMAPQQSAVLSPGHVGLVQLVLQAPVSAC